MTASPRGRASRPICNRTAAFPSTNLAFSAVIANWTADAHSLSALFGRQRSFAILVPGDAEGVRRPVTIDQEFVRAVNLRPCRRNSIAGGSFPSRTQERTMNQIIKSAAISLMAASLLSATAIAEDAVQRTPGSDISVGTGVVCDTAQQVERLASLMEQGNVESAVSTVNTEANNPRACGMVLAAFVRGDEVGEVHNANKALKVVEITILAVPVGNQWQYVAPLKQYTAFAPKGVEI
jgi:hypothetical protein